nr:MULTISPECIES: hypothetical protein [Pseudomonas]
MNRGFEMRFRPQHCHLTVAVCAMLGAVKALFIAEYFLSFILLSGGVVALIHWKAIKSGLIDL